MKLGRLKEVARRLRPTEHVPTDKDGLVAYIAKHHPQMERNQSRLPMVRAQPADLYNLYEQLGLHTSSQSVAIANYNAYKGFVDASNKDEYLHFRLSGHLTWSSLTAASVLHALLLNAWVSHEEHVLATAHKSNPRLTTAALIGMRGTFPEFVASAIEQLIGEIKV